MCLKLTFSGSQAGYFYFKTGAAPSLYILILIKDIRGRVVARRHGSDIYDSVSFAGEIWVLQQAYSAVSDCSAAGFSYYA